MIKCKVVQKLFDICWNRNSTLFQNCSVELNGNVRPLELLKIVDHLGSSDNLISNHPSVSLRSPPMSNWIKINFNYGLDIDMTTMALGVTAHDTNNGCYGWHWKRNQGDNLHIMGNFMQLFS